MVELFSNYPYASLEEKKDADGNDMYAAYTDSDCCDEIDFVITAPGDESRGDVVIWFAREWAFKNVKDGRIEHEQCGYVWHGVERDTFAEIISNPNSIGAVANSELIQVRVADDVVWRTYTA